MQVEISEKARQTIDEFVREGAFESESAALDAAVALLEAKRDAYWAKVNELVEEGRQDFRDGRFRELTHENKHEIVAEIGARGKARLEAKRRT